MKYYAVLRTENPEYGVEEVLVVQKKSHPTLPFSLHREWKRTQPGPGPGQSVFSIIYEYPDLEVYPNGKGC